jgi:hypothetical protein
MHAPTNPTTRNWLLATTAAASLNMLAACGGSDDGAPAAPPAAPPAQAPAPAPAPAPIPPAAVSLQTKLIEDMGRSLARLATIESDAVIAVVPGMPLAPNVANIADASAAAPLHTFDVRGTFDGNGDGIEETTLDARIRYGNDPDDFVAAFGGAQGSASVGIRIPGVMHVYQGDFSFTAGMSEHRVSGGGTFTNPLTGATATLTIDAAEPMIVRPADGVTARPNACAHSFGGSARLGVTAAAGSLASQWRFASDSTIATVTGLTFTPVSGQPVALPDTQVDLGCGSTAVGINDWNGRFRIQWACVPREHGEFNTTISVKDATTVTILDDGDSPAEAYEATLIGASARAIRGFFLSGPAGSRYREDFSWTLNLDGRGFSQASRYVYFEGAQTGKGGICAARATRIS